MTDKGELQEPYDFLPIGVMGLTRERHVSVWNRCMESWSGVTRAGIIDRLLVDVFPAYDETKFSERLNQVFDDGTPIVLSALFHGQVVPLKRLDGSPRVHRATVTSIPGKNGEPVALFVIQDVTDLTQQVRAFRNMRKQAVAATDRAEAAKQLAERRNDQLAEVNRELEQFAYLASHDLQEPLRTLVSFSTFLKEDLGGDLPEAAMRDLEYIGSAAARMRTLIEDLLALSRVNRAEFLISKTPLAEIVEDAAAALGDRLKQSGAEITAVDLPQVTGDRRLLTQLLQNVIGNSIKFAFEGQPPRIAVSAQKVDSQCVVSIRDNGIGLEPEYLEKVFAPFQRLHGIDEYPGSGMGLAICKRIAQRHGGKIWAESEVHGGACFRFTLSDEND